mgnify:CR=1 FL=1
MLGAFVAASCVFRFLFHHDHLFHHHHCPPFFVVAVVVVVVGAVTFVAVVAAFVLAALVLNWPWCHRDSLAVLVVYVPRSHHALVYRPHI